LRISNNGGDIHRLHLRDEYYYIHHFNLEENDMKTLCRANRLQPRKNILTNKHDQETQLEQEVYQLIDKVKNEKKDLNWRQWFRIDQAVDILVTDVQRRHTDCKRLTEQEERDNPNYYHN
jgi:hypothetical protein